MVINKQDVEWVIYFTRAEIEPILAAGDGRQDFAEASGYENYGLPLTLEQQRENNRFAAVGEYLAAGAFKLKFDPSIGKIDSVDLGIIEVRARLLGRSKGTDLPIRGDEDKLRLPHVLIRVDMAGLRAWIPGWLLGWEAMERPDKVEFESRGQRWWYIPPPYHTPRSLQQWIECGHPLHYAPEKYCK